MKYRNRIILSKNKYKVFQNFHISHLNLMLIKFILEITKFTYISTHKYSGEIVQIIYQFTNA